MAANIIDNLYHNISFNCCITIDAFNLLKLFLDNKPSIRIHNLTSIIFKICEFVPNIHSVSCIKILVDVGANIKCIDNKMQTVFTLLCANKINKYTVECVDILIKATYTNNLALDHLLVTETSELETSLFDIKLIDIFRWKFLLDICCNDYTPLMMVCNNTLDENIIKLIKLLIDAGANVDASFGIPNSPLGLVCSKEINNLTPICVEILADANSSEFARDANGNNALMLLSKDIINEYTLECFKILINKLDFNLSETNNDGYNVLMLLCSNKLTEHTLDCLFVLMKKQRYIHGSYSHYTDSLVLLLDNINEHTEDAINMLIEKYKHHGYNQKIVIDAIVPVFFASDSYIDPNILDKIKLLNKIVFHFYGETLLQLICKNMKFTKNHHDMLMLIILKSDVTIGTDTNNAMFPTKTAYQYFLSNPTSIDILSESELRLLEGVTKINNTKSARLAKN